MGSRSIVALPTRYAGVLFRSRLEARWAVFFDHLGLRWEYEPEGFKLPSGECYLPDFWLPELDGGTYAEVKPHGDPFLKMREFASVTESVCWLCDGEPSSRWYGVLHPTWPGPSLGWPYKDYPWRFYMDGGEGHELGEALQVSSLVSASNVARSERFGT